MNENKETAPDPSDSEQSQPQPTVNITINIGTPSPGIPSELPATNDDLVHGKSMDESYGNDLSVPKGIPNAPDENKDDSSDGDKNKPTTTNSTGPEHHG